MNNEVKQNTPSIITEKLLSSLSEEQRTVLAEHYTTIKHENSETKVELSDPLSANRESKLNLYVFALIALIIIVFLFK